MESLIGVTPSTPEHQEGVSDDRGVRLFVHLWNEKYPDYHVRIQRNPHDFGSYPDVGISDADFSRGISDNETFKDGIEDAAGDLIDEWNANIASIDNLKWAEIARGARLKETVPFQLSY